LLSFVIVATSSFLFSFVGFLTSSSSPTTSSPLDAGSVSGSPSLTIFFSISFAVSSSLTAPNLALIFLTFSAV